MEVWGAPTGIGSKATAVFTHRFGDVKISLSDPTH
jgi:hypothetical protein